MYLREECEKTTSTTLRFFARARQPLAPLAHPTSRYALGEAGVLLFSRTPIARVTKKDSLAAVEETGRK